MAEQTTTQPVVPTEGQTAGMDVFKEQPVTPLTETAVAQPAATPTPSTSTGLSKEDMAKILKEAGIGQQAAPATQSATQQPMSQEDFDRAFNVVKVTPQSVAKLRLALAAADDGAEAAGILQDFLYGAVKQAVTMVNYQQALLKEELTGTIQPVLSHYQQQKMAEAKQEFFKKFPDLQGYEPITENVVAQMQAQGWKGSKDEAFAEVEKRTRELLKKIPGLNGQAAATTTGAQAPQQQQSRMSTLTGGGQGAGATSGAASGGSKRSGMELFN